MYKGTIAITFAVLLEVTAEDALLTATAELLDVDTEELELREDERIDELSEIFDELLDERLELDLTEITLEETVEGVDEATTDLALELDITTISELDDDDCEDLLDATLLGILDASRDELLTLLELVATLIALLTDDELIEGADDFALSLPPPPPPQAVNTKAKPDIRHVLVIKRI